MDLAALYVDAQLRVIDLVSPLAPPALASWVPGAPRWTIAQVICHVTGVCADLADGNVDGAATEPWTSRQVAQREGCSLSDVLAEWRERTPALVAMLATPGLVDASAFDLLVHEHDLRGALGLAGPSDEAAVFGVTSRVTGRVDHLVRKAGLPPLRLVGDSSSWVCGDEPGVGVTGTASTMEWFRCLFGRRSPAQIRTYEWSGDPEPYFDLLNLFGPLPSADVTEAGAPIPLSSLTSD
jgi:uncharacterized protein (TIGR03083 family)